ncbi:50S ribosomal protein L24 [Cognatazoarcus halotolerans]|uniref:50S ribosomal protein L24 n=1 Tax=Cognatazoarcus halotolerans TaxID=2686016 RepID=UPI00135CE670|nr:50S ribosomal protein L24 [Cognatazoarcus halotolerans]MBX3679962.1 50S ribosomal protein L24 [Rhodocyclaceae bacterium]MCP5232481.1 50S ribosomal protein L24 [Zoogloeaceae bacterium]MCB1900946.1 50S ribosomal protein L24 [Rhodocyclaceae bacterium]MCP5240110.1 50S ribosomal protein L24 [Zoogloeaceae bacterium]MCP5253663.1 50S ribosomal protein L24 [Zoogloeaceae bacterium]
MNKIRKGDEVVILAGKDRGRRGAVLRRVDDEHVVVEGINRVKKHVRPNPMKGQVGGIVEKEMPINVSNVALFNPATQKADRVGIKVLEDGRKVRFFKSNGEVVEA